jgi:nicotinamidase-related amidase
MTTFTDRRQRALVVIDVQDRVMEGSWDRERVEANIRSLVAAARENDVPVVWVQHNDEQMTIGSDAWQLVDGLDPREGEPRIDKQFRNSFESTDLDDVLAGLGVGSLLICGAQTNNCVRHTLHGAIDRGYDVVLVEDAHTTTDQEWDNGVISAAFTVDEQNRSSLDYQLPGRACTLATAAEAFA